MRLGWEAAIELIHPGGEGKASKTWLLTVQRAGVKLNGKADFAKNRDCSLSTVDECLGCSQVHWVPHSPAHFCVILTLPHMAARKLTKTAVPP